MKRLVLLWFFITFGTQAEITAVLHQQLDQLTESGRFPPTPEQIALLSKQFAAEADTAVLTRLQAYRIATSVLGVEQQTEQLQALLQDMQQHGSAEQQLDVLLVKGEAELQVQQLDVLQQTLEAIQQLIQQPVVQRQQYPVFSLLGRIQQLTGDYESSLSFLSQAYDAIGTSQDKIALLRRQLIKSHVARVHIRQHNNTYAKEIIERVIAESELHGLYQLLPEFYLIYGYVLNLVDGATDESMAALVKASQPAPGQPMGRVQLVALNNIGSTYFHRGEFQRAEQYYRQGIIIAEQSGYETERLVILFNLGYIEVQLADVTAGLAQMEQAYEAFIRLAPLSDQVSMLGYLAEAYHVAGKPEKEAATLREQLKKRELDMQTVRNNIMAELQVKYEAQEKSLHIKLLEQEAELKQALLEASVRNQFWYGVMILILAVAFLISLFVIKHVRKLNGLLHQANEESELLSRKDPLTRLDNRRALSAFKQQKGDLLILLDVDHFKQINDLHGHNAGDVVLVAVADMLKAMVRAEDFVLRWGGEEFLLLIRQAGEEQADAIISKLLAALTEQPIAGIKVSVSGGLVSVPESQISLESLIKQADTLLYDAKQAGRARVFGLINGQSRIWSLDRTAEALSGFAADQYPVHTAG